MTYEPKINVFDDRPIKNNLINYFKANQADALKWANDNSSLPPVKAFHTEMRTIRVFPSLSMIQSSHLSSYQGDFLLVDYSLLLEAYLMHGKEDYLTEISSKYKMAYESMLVNCPETTLLQNTKIVLDAGGIEDVNTEFDVQGTLKKNSFIQIFQTRARWLFKAAALQTE